MLERNASVSIPNPWEPDLSPRLVPLLGHHALRAEGRRSLDRYKIEVSLAPLAMVQLRQIHAPRYNRVLESLEHAR